jgi:hypothetical protein
MDALRSNAFLVNAKSRFSQGRSCHRRLFCRWPVKAQRLPGNASQDRELLVNLPTVPQHQFWIVGIALEQVVQIGDGFKGVVDFVHDGGGKLACYRETSARAQTLTKSDPLCLVVFENLIHGVPLCW